MPGLLSILSIIGQSLKVFGQIMGWIQQERQTQTGIDLQRGTDAEAALAVAQKVAAVAATPVTQADVDKALSKGGEW